MYKYSVSELQEFFSLDTWCKIFNWQGGTIWQVQKEIEKRLQYNTK